MTLLLFKILTKKLWWILLLVALLNLFFFERLSTNSLGFYPHKGHTKMTFFLFALQAFAFAIWAYFPKSQVHLFKQLFAHKSSQLRCISTVYLMFALLTQWLPLFVFITLIAPSGTYFILDAIGFFAIWLFSLIGFAVGVLCAVTRQKHAVIFAFLLFPGLLMLDGPVQVGLLLWCVMLGLLVALTLAPVVWRNIALTLLYTLILSELLVVGWHILTPQFPVASLFTEQQTSEPEERVRWRYPNKNGEFLSGMYSLNTHVAFSYRQWDIRPDWLNHRIHSSRLENVAYPKVWQQNKSNFEHIWQSDFQHQIPLHFEFAGGQQAFMFDQAIMVESPDGTPRKIWSTEDDGHKITHSLIHSDSVKTAYSWLLLRHDNGYTWIVQDSDGAFSSTSIALNKPVWFVKGANVEQRRTLQLVTSDGVRYQYRWPVGSNSVEEVAQQNVSTGYLAPEKVRLLINPALTTLVMSDTVLKNKNLASFVKVGLALNVLWAFCMFLLQYRAKPRVRVLTTVVSLLFGFAAFLAAILIFKPELWRHREEFGELNDIGLAAKTAHIQ